MMGRLLFVPLYCLILGASGLAHARTWYVTPDGSGDALTIQAGVNAASSGDEILVAAGTYYENDISVKGGIWIHSESGSEVTIIDGGYLGRLLQCESLSSSSTIEGFTLQNGGPFEIWQGGAILSQNSPLEIRNCRFLGNQARHGGAIYVGGSGGSITVESCYFANNMVADGRHRGGAIQADGGGHATIRFCQFINNEGKYGGGVFVYLGSSADIEDCWFEGNRGYSTGGAFQCNGGSFSILRSVFVGNVADNNGAGAIMASEGAPGTIESCVFWANDSQRAAIEFVDWNGPPTIQFNNNIVANNLVTGVLATGSTNLVAECNDVWGNMVGDWSGHVPVASNFSADPLFCDAPNGDFTLMSTSPCLPGNHPDGYDCGLIGAFGEGCSGPSAVEKASWGSVKAMFR